MRDDGAEGALPVRPRACERRSVARMREDESAGSLGVREMRLILIREGELFIYFYEAFCDFRRGANEVSCALVGVGLINNAWV